MQHLDRASLALVPVLIAAAARADGSPALSEAGDLALRRARRGVHHLGVFGDAGLVGYAQVSVTGRGRGRVAGCVHPDHRRRGLGAALARAVTDLLPSQVLAWAHGDHPGAAALAARTGAQRVRELWQMRRRLTAADAAAPDPPAGVVLRPFVVGRDERAWLAANAAAFAGHPEQGGTTADDLRERQQQPWFDPDGFLLAEDTASGDLLGFHWTKVHPHSPRGPAVGEVYVLGVAPAAQGRRLGGVLLRAGLAHLASRSGADGAPLAEVLLYVEADNAPAAALYRRHGFEVTHVDVQYRLDARPAPSRS